VLDTSVMGAIMRGAGRARSGVIARALISARRCPSAKAPAGPKHVTTH
jgi:hypothetical protein